MNDFVFLYFNRGKWEEISVHDFAEIYSSGTGKLRVITEEETAEPEAQQEQE